MEQQSEGIKTFLRKAAEKSGVEFNEDKANTLIQSYNNDYDKLVKDVAKKVGYKDTQLDEFRDRAFKEYGITPVASAAQSEPIPGQYSQWQTEFEKNKAASKPIASDDKPSFLSEMGARITKSNADLGSMISKVPGFLYDVAAIPQNIIADQFDIPSLKTSSQQVSDVLGIKNIIAEYYDKGSDYYAQKIATNNPKYQQGVIESISKGDWGTAGRNLLGGILESSAPSIAMMATAGMGVPAMIGAGTAVFGAGKKAELDENAPQMSEQNRTMIALSNGAIEGLFETALGSGAMGMALKNVITKSFAEGGEEIAKKEAKKLINQTFVKMLEKNPELGMLGEGLEEVGTQFAQNAVDKYSGYRPEINISDGAGDAFLMGIGMGGMMSAPIRVAQYIGEDSYNNVQKRITAKREFQAVSTAFKDIPNANYTEAIENIVRNYTDPKDITTAFNQISQEMGVSQPEYQTAFNFLQSSVKVNSMNKAKVEEIQKGIDTFRDNDGNVTTAIINGEEVFIRNTQDLGQEGRAIFAKNKAGEVKAFRADQIKDWNTQTPDQIIQTSNTSEQAEDDEYVKSEDIKQAASEIGIAPNKSVKTPNGIAKVATVNGDGTVTVVNQKGIEDVFNIDELEPYKTDEQKQAEKDALIQQKESEKLQLQQQQEAEKAQAEADKLAQQQAEARQARTDIPVDKEGNPDYDQMEPEMFFEEYSKEFGEEEAKNEIKGMQSAIVEKIKKLGEKKTKATSPNERAKITREIKSLTGQLDNINAIVEKGRPKANEAQGNIQWIAKNSTNPDEIAAAYDQEAANTPDQNLKEWHKYILGVKFNPESFTRFNDKNNIGQTLANTWLNSDGHDIDQYVRDNFEDVPEFNNVTVQDVVDFIVDNPNGYIRKTTDLQKELRRKYREITGTSIDNRKFDQETQPTQEKLDKFLTENNLQNSWFSTEDLINLVEQNKDKLQENDYREFTDFLNSELEQDQSRSDDWLKDESEPDIQGEVSPRTSIESSSLSSAEKKDEQPINTTSSFSNTQKQNQSTSDLQSSGGASIESPLTKQYNKIKKEYPNALVIFKFNGFAEMMGIDAENASSILGIPLTKKGNQLLSGFDLNMIDTYLPKLLKAGHQVALVEDSSVMGLQNNKTKLTQKESNVSQNNDQNTDNQIQVAPSGETFLQQNKNQEAKSSPFLNISPKATEDLKERRNALNALDQISSELNQSAEIINSEEIPENIKNIEKQRIAEGKEAVGFYNPEDNKVYIISDRITKVSEAKKTFIHEMVVHKGLKGLFDNGNSQSIIGKQYSKFTDLMNDVYGSMNEKDIESIVSDYGFSKDTDKAAIAEEYLAHLSESETIPTQWQSFIDRLVHLIRKTFGLTSGQFTQSDLFNIIKEQRERLAQGQNVNNKSEGEVKMRIQEMPDKNLIALHNITADQIMNADRTGGLITPSLAIVKKGEKFTDFGNITLVGNRELIDPEKSSVKVFKGDVYSPTVPRPEYYRNEKPYQSWVREIMNKAYDGEYRPMANIIQNIIDDFGSFGKSIKRYDPKIIKKDEYESMKPVYLLEREIPFKVPMAEKTHYLWNNANFVLSKEEKAQYKPIYDKAVAENREGSLSPETKDKLFNVFSDIIWNQVIRKSDDPIVQQHYDKIGKEVEEREIGTKENPIINWHYIDRLGEALRGTKELDEKALLESINKTFKKVPKQDYDNWLDEKINSFQGSRYFEKGNQKLPYTVENLIEATTGHTRAKEKGMTYGMNRAKASAIAQLKNIDQIRRAQKDLVSKEEMTAIEKDMQEQYFEVANSIAYKYGDQWGKLDDFGKSLADYFKGNSPYGALSRNDFKPSKNDLDNFKEFADKLKNSPIDYLEAKTQRLVGLDEFSHAVVPTTTDKETIAILKKNGIKVSKYTNNDDRAMVLDNVIENNPQVRFRLSDKKTPAAQIQINWDSNDDFKRSAEFTPEETENYKTKPDKGITYMERLITNKGHVQFMGEALTGPAKITSANDVAFLFKNLESAATENAFLVMMDKKNRYRVVYIGTGGTTGVVMDIPALINSINEFKAKSFVFVHNHPSGNLKASDADIAISEQMQEAAKNLKVTMMPSVIIDTDKGEYSEINLDSRTTDISTKTPMRDEVSPVDVYHFDRQKLYVPSTSRHKISSSRDAAIFLSQQKRGTNDKIHAMIVDRQNAVTRYILLDGNMPESELISTLISESAKHGEAVVLSSNGIIPNIKKIDRNLKLIGSKILDVITVKQDADIINIYESMADEGLLYEPEQVYGNKLPETITINGVERPTTNSKGQPIADTEEKIRNFYEWFGDSKVVDEEGRPLVVYHGTEKDFTEFSIKHFNSGSFDGGWLGKGFYATNDYDYANSYKGKDSGDTMSLYYSLNNPYVLTDYLYSIRPNKLNNELGVYNSGEATFKLKKNGFDGVMLNYKDDNNENFFEVVAFEPTQIKSATGNQGTFDKSNPDIRFRVVDRPKEPSIQELWPDAKVNVASTGTIYAELDDHKVRIGNHEPNYGAPRPHDYTEIYTEDIEGKKLDWIEKLADIWGETPKYLKYANKLSDYYLKLDEYYKPLREQQLKEKEEFEREKQRKIKLANTASDEWVNETDKLAIENGKDKSNGDKRRKAVRKTWEKRSKELLGESLTREYFLNWNDERVKLQNPDIRFRIAKDQQELDDFVKDSEFTNDFYHRSPNVFTEFNNDKIGTSTDAGWLGQGFYFYGDRNEAVGYGDNEYVVKLNVENPYFATDEENQRLAELNDPIESKKYSDEIQSEGYDAIYYNGNLRQEIVVFSPDQILIKPQDNIRFRIDKASEEVNTNPTDAQKEAGNYAKGHVRFDGFDISIENPKGSTRSGVDQDGESWESVLPVDYGYFRGTVGKDKDHIDVFIGSKPEIDKVYVVDQINPKTGNFDEHKVMLGFNGVTEARKAYQSSYPKGWEGLKNITRTTKEGLKDWFENGNTKKPFADSDIRFRLAYHGSPHQFDKFTTEKIGTGEGNQAFGWGLYFTDKKSIAETYAKTLGQYNMIQQYRGMDVEPQSPLDSAAGIINDYQQRYNTIPKAIKRAEELKGYVDKDNFKMIKYWDDVIDWLKHSKISDFKRVPNKNLYAVELHGGKEPGEYDYLRWDKPVGEKQQTKFFNKAREEKLPLSAKDWAGKSDIFKDGKSLYDYLTFIYRLQGINKLVEDGIIGQERFSMNDNQIYDKAASLFLLRAGIDGIQYPTEVTSKGSHEESFNYVIFDENAVEIKEHIRFRQSEKPIQSEIGFYSPTEKALNSIQQEKGTVGQFEAMLLKNGAKQAELDWMGWKQQFPSVNQKVTKADIQNWIDQNKIEVKEVQKGKESKWDGNDLINANGEIVATLVDNEDGTWSFTSNFSEGEDYFESKERAKLAAEQETVEDVYGENATKYEQYVEPGGSNYKELLLTMPEPKDIKKTGGFKIYDGDTLLVDGTMPMKQRAIDMLAENPTYRVEYENYSTYDDKKQSGVFQSSHFDEPNILAHVRFDERTVNGERVLFIQEFQSDWAQKGKKEGFKSDSRKVIAESLRKEKDNFYTKLNQSEDEQVEYGLSQFESGKITREQLDKILLANGYSEYDLKSAAETNSVPDMPFKKTDQWVNLSIRRMMRYAAENGFDRIAWTNGEQQAARYDLSKQVSEINYDKKANGDYILTVRDKKNYPFIEHKTYKENELEDVVGKEISNKIVNGEGEYVHMKGNVLSGLDLKVGGEGMKAFYDAIVPSAASKLGKPFGAKVENIQIPLAKKSDYTIGEANYVDGIGVYDSKGDMVAEFDTKEEANDFILKQSSTSVQSLPVTDKMKESVTTEGVPMFRVQKAEKPPVSVNENVNTNLKQAHGIKKEPLSDKVQRWGQEMKETVQHFKYVTEKEFPSVYNKLRLFESIPEVVRKEAYEKIADIIRPIAKDKNLYEGFEKYIVLRDLMSDINRGLYEGKELPWGYTDKDEVRRDVDNISKYVNDNPWLRKAVANRNTLIYKTRDELINNKLLGEKSREKEDYFHHQVLAYMDDKLNNTDGTGARDVRLHKKGWQRSRTGSMKAYNTNYLESEFEVIAQSLSQLETKSILNKIGAEVNIMPSLVAKANNEGGKWQDYIPEGYSKWYPKSGTNAYKAASMAEKAVQNIIGEKITPEMEEMIAEADKTMWVIPTPIAKQLDSMKSSEHEILPVRAMRYFNSSWKQWILMNPYRVLKYNLNNMSGDLDIVLAYNPKILLPQYAHTALKELHANLTGKGLSQDMKEALSNGVITSGLSISEIPDINKEGIFKSLTGHDNLIMQYWNKTKDYTQFRENLLRLATYKYFKDQISKGKKVYGASNKPAIDALTDTNEKAGKLARELIGDYGNLSQGGQWLRSHIYPFWSWMEINAPRYYRLLRNTAYEDQTGLRTAGAVVTKTALNATKLTGKMLILAGMVTLWNSLFFHDEDEELTKTGNRQLRLIVGRRDDGSIMTIRISGAFSDVLSFVGLEDAPQDIRDIKEGKTTVGKKVKEGGSAFVNKIAQGAMPIEKTIAETILGKSFYPDIFNPRPIRDKGENALKIVSMDKIYRYLTKKPLRGAKELSNFILYDTDPGEAAYYTMRQKIYDFLDENEVPSPSGEPTERSNALYYYKQSKKLGDVKLANHWLAKYMKLGGTKKGMKASIAKGEVLAPLPTKYRYDVKKPSLRKEFEASLDAEDREVLKMAEDWYEKTYNK